MSVVVEELREDIAKMVHFNISLFAQGNVLHDKELLLRRIYDDIEDFLQTSTDMQVMVCQPAPTEPDNDCDDKNMKFFILVEDDFGVCIDISPFFIQGLSQTVSLSSILNLIRIDAISREVLEVIKKTGGC